MQKQILIQTLETFDLFKPLSAQTKHLIAYEASHRKSFCQGELIMPFSKKSLWNSAGAHIYHSYKPMVATLDETTQPLVKPSHKVKRSKTNQSLYSEYF